MKHQSRRGLLGVAFAVGIVAIVSVASISAHHGWGGYEENILEIAGTVTSSVSLAGPHATMKVKANDHAWDVVLAPPPRAVQAGLKEGLIPVGASVVVHGNRHMDPKKFEIKTSKLTWNNRVFNVYPDRD